MKALEVPWCTTKKCENKNLSFKLFEMQGASGFKIGDIHMWGSSSKGQR